MILGIAVTPDMLETSRTDGGGEYKFQKVFSEGEFIASGVLELPVGTSKPVKNSHSSAMVLFTDPGVYSDEWRGRSAGT